MSVYDGWPRWRQIVYDRWVRMAGTETLLAHHWPPRLVCINCGSIVAFRDLLLRWRWRYTACPSCEGYEHYMVDESRRSVG